jgi:DNA repair protein RecN (Recombination protein N)
MLSEITIKDLAIIEDITLQFNRGFNVLTGETGTGKSIILDAVSLLIGGRADSEHVRSGARQALIEGVFVLDEGPAREHVQAVLEREGLEGDDPGVLMLSREVRRGGRNICRVNGRMTTLSVVLEIGEALVDIHGQSEHLSLLKPASHLGLLDRFAGLGTPREKFAALVYRVQQVRRDLKDLMDNEQALKRRAESLAYQIEEISSLNLKPGEDEELRDEARRLANAEQLAAVVQEAYQAIYGAPEGGFSASDLLSQADSALARLLKFDPGATEIAGLAESVSVQVEELGRMLSDYENEIEFNPARLQEVELRLDLIRTLKRKYNCEAIEDLLQSIEKARQDLERIEHSNEEIERLKAEEMQLLDGAGRQAAELSAARTQAAEKLSRAVEAELNDLRMENAQFSVSIEQVDDPDGVPVGDYRLAFDKTGIDRVEFLIAPNLGEPLKPIARIASGGETSRIMLALKTVLSRADHIPTLIFDEIDAGIGGRIGAVVGHKLWRLTQAHQVLVVTHLPQLAGFADAHFRVEKQVKGNRTITVVEGLKNERQVDELAAMLGAESQTSRQNAAEILEYVTRIKAGGVPETGG